MARQHYLEDIEIYPYPNPALTEVLLDPRLKALVTEKTHQVLAVYVGKIAARKRKDDKHKGNMLRNTSADIHIGGFKNDRWVGEITVGVEYALADELGRKAYAPYSGSGDLQESLYSVLPYSPQEVQ